MKYLITLILILLGTSSWYTTQNNFIDIEVSILTTQKKPFKGFISKPDDNKKHPAVLILLGSGRGSTDNPSRSYNPFREISHKLAKEGIIVLRFDKRGTGYNKDAGTFETQSIKDYYSDAVSALNYLKKDPSVNPNKITVYGHSLGTFIAAQLAGSYTLQGVILSAGPSEPPFVVLKEQQFLLNNVLYPKDLVKVNKEVNNELGPIEKINTGKFNFNECEPKRCKLVGAVETLDDQSLTFWREFLTTDMKDLISKIRPSSSILCLGGSSDWVVDPRHTFINYKNAKDMKLNASHHLIKDLDHFLSLSPSQESNIKAILKKDVSGFKLSHEYYQKILKFLKEVVNK